MPHKKFSERILQRIERLGDIGHWRWDIASESLFWSSGVYRIHGLEFNEYTPTIDAAIDAYLPEDRIDVEEAISLAIEKKESFNFEKRIKRPNGDVRHVVTNGECETGENGELVAIFGIIKDISALKQQEELYELAALGSSAALWDWDVKTDDLFWAGHSANILGYEENKDLPNTTKNFLEELVHPEDREKIRTTITNHFSNHDEFSMQVRIKNADDSYSWFASRAQAQFNEIGYATRVCGSFSSIQELKEAQKKLEKSNTDLQDFAYVAAHEIKSPLRGIASYLELIKMSGDDIAPKTMSEYMEKSLEIANDMSHMVDDLLEYASLKDAKLSFGEVNLDKTLKLILRTMKEEIKTNEATIDFGTFPTAICEEAKVKHIIVNLIQNALKYKSDKKPHITITSGENETHWTFSIKDNGLGMPADKIDTIFKMFERLGNTGDIKGTGIGLAICERIAHLHNGKIWAESEEGKGSNFHFTLSKNLKPDIN